MAKKTNKKSNKRVRILRVKMVKPRTMAIAPPQYAAFPQNKTVVMKYSVMKNPSLFAGPNPAAIYDFCANGIYDPDVSIGGTYPTGYSNWAAFYNHYIVKSSICKVTFWVSDEGANDHRIMGTLGLDDDQTLTYPSAMVLIDRPTYKHKIINCRTGQAPIQTISTKYSARKFFNIKDSKDNFLRIGAPIGSNPTETAIFKAGIVDLDDTTSGGGPAVNMLLQITYVVEFSEPKVLNNT